MGRMKALVTKTSDWNHSEIKEFNSLEEILSFMHIVNHPLILGIPEQEEDFTIEIYDAYRE